MILMPVPKALAKTGVELQLKSPKWSKNSMNFFLQNIFTVFYDSYRLQVIINLL